MKKFLQRVVLVAMAMATAQVAVAESWRINNDTSKGAHFASINDAMASEDVKDGDVLYLDPGANITGDQTINKAVTVIGTGWEFNDRPYTSAKITGTLTIYSSATITGLNLEAVNPRANNIIIERCRISGAIIANKYTAQHLMIRQCYMSSRIDGSGSNSSLTLGWNIYNNIIVADYMGCIIRNLLNATIANNYIWGKSSGTSATHDVIGGLEQSVVKNNILINGELHDYITPGPSTNEIYNNCISASAETWSLIAHYPNNTCVGSKVVTDFIVNSGLGGSWVQLCEGSPAIGAGEGGIDCGPYAKGSLYPFVTYGMPKHIPYFTEAAVPAQPTDGKVKVSLKIVNQND